MGRMKKVAEVECCLNEAEFCECMLILCGQKF